MKTNKHWLHQDMQHMLQN